MDGRSNKLLALDGLAALSSMEQALQHLDRCEGVDAVGAHLDLVICRLRDIMTADGIALPARPSGEPKV